MAVCPQQAQTLGFAFDRCASECVRGDLSVPASVARSKVVVGDWDDPPNEQTVPLWGRHLAGVEECGVLVVVAGMEMGEELFVVALRDPY
jgi:hypothetical protein